jgi:hypothetical protein
MNKDEEPEMFQSVKDLQKPNTQMRAMGGGCVLAIVLMVFLTAAGLKGGLIMMIPAAAGFGLYWLMTRD